MSSSEIATAERLERRAGAIWHEHGTEAEHLKARAWSLRINAGQSYHEALHQQAEQIDIGYMDGSS